LYFGVRFHSLMKENESLNMFFAMGVFNVQRCKS
jgi:hypothetical protein